MSKVQVTASLPNGEKIAEWTTDEDGTHRPVAPVVPADVEAMCKELIAVADDLGVGDQSDFLLRVHAMLRSLSKDAERYRFIRSEEATHPRYYSFWKEFEVKLCREEKMDAHVDAALAAKEQK